MIDLPTTGSGVGKVGNSISGFPFLEKYDLSDIRFFYGYSSTAKKGNCRNPFTY